MTERVRRYLSPEPLLQDPEYLQGMARAGYSTPSYAYALNNPITYSDPDGKAAGTLVGGGIGTLIIPGPGTIIGAVVGTIVVGAGISQPRPPPPLPDLIPKPPRAPK